ncbi:MAG: F0F1 ATP synthase subunit A [Bacteroidales bacterium]|nr:F0F1 ATP synthase subunit A [Bacteroidales bacterium]
MGLSSRGKRVYVVFLIFFLLIFSLGINASEKKGKTNIYENEKHEIDAEHEDFNAGEMILEHVKDMHEWHIATIGEKHITIPLPVILYDRDKEKLHVFMSSRFHHGHDSYKGFKLTEDQNIVPVKTGTLAVDESRSEPLDFSITKTAAGVFVTSILLVLIFLSVAKRYKTNPESAPKGLQSLLEPVILFIRDDVAKPSIGEKKYERFLPFLLTMFFFILFANLLGLVPFFPGGANITGNITVTMVLAVFTFLATTFSGNKHYWKHIFNTPGVPWWLKFPIPLMPIVEVLGMITKPFVLMVRLFANILAGHIIVLGFVSLIFIFSVSNAIAGYGVSVFSVAFTVFIDFLELLVAFIQAYVFTLLSALYLGMATEEAH